jgi:precorrin-2 dehydrogenase/sirohydrochlorin ferrochelatase
MLVDLSFQNKIVIIIGEGDELETRVRQFRDAGAKVIVVDSGPNKKHLKSVKIVKWKGRGELDELIEKYNPYALILATTNKQLASKISKSARRQHPGLIYAVDMPDLNDFNMLAVAKLGNVRVAISTGGLSPAMASILRKKIERNITTEDLQQIRLQALMRDRIKHRIKNAEIRKRCVYKIIHDRQIRKYLQDHKFEQAKKLASKQIESMADREMP